MRLFNQALVEAEMTRVFEYAESTFHLVQPLFEGPEKREGYAYTLRYGHEDEHYLRTVFIGKPDKEKRPVYGHFSREKISRTGRLGQQTSLQSVNESAMQYAGGIIFTPWADGISGMKQYDDHCLAIANAVFTLRMSLALAHEYAGILHFERLKRFLQILPGI